MKIKTVNELEEAVHRETAWRMLELSCIRENVRFSDGKAKDPAMRAGIALLYAHWEGAIKSIATHYLEYVSSLDLSYNQLKHNFLALTIRYDLQMFDESKKSTLHTAIVSNVIEKQSDKSKIPTKNVIRTESNLNSEVFSEIMATIGLPSDKYEPSYKLIDELLLGKRNRIAHGEYIGMIDIDETRYFEIHDKVRELINMFAEQVLDAAISSEYLRASPAENAC